MLDPTLVLALRQLPAPPRRVDVADESAWLSSDASTAERRLLSLVEGQEFALRDWRERTLRARRMIEASGQGQDWPEQEIESLSDLIEDIETAADHKAAASARAEKKFVKTLHHLSQMDISLAAVYRAAQRRLAALDIEAIEVMLDSALYLRAVRADHEPDSGTGPTFTDIGGLKGHLQSLL